MSQRTFSLVFLQFTPFYRLLNDPAPATETNQFCNAYFCNPRCTCQKITVKARLLIGREPKNVSFTMRNTGSHLRGRFMYPETAGNVCASRTKN